MHDDNSQFSAPTKSAYATVQVDDADTTTTGPSKIEEKDEDSEDHDLLPEIRSLDPGTDPVYLLQEDLKLPALSRYITWVFG